MPLTRIQSITPSNSGTVTFSSIPQSYSHLYLFVLCQGVTLANFDRFYFRVVVDNDTSNAGTNIYFENNSTVAGQNTTAIAPRFPGANNSYNPGYLQTVEVFVANYTTTTRGKGIFYRGGAIGSSIGNSSQNYGVGFYNQTNAVNAIYISTLSGNNFSNTKTTFTLYGIA